MKKTLNIFIGLVILLAIMNCSTRKDAFINRQYHAMSTKYNVLYNGELAFLDGLDALNYNYEDDFWNVLPIEPLKVDELALPGMMGDSDSSPKEFEKAEEKAVKAIQKHSMLIDSRERNSQIDAAYLLLGKARYYSKRFVPALEAFNYIIINYPTADLINETWVWRSKTHVRLQNEEIAIDRLKTLLKKESISKVDMENVHTTMAMAYQSLDSIPQVIYHLNQAVLTDYNKEQTARNFFVLGQLYRSENKIDSSDIAFQKIINFGRAPYKYKIHAEIEQAKNVDSNEEASAMVEELQKLIKDRYNRPYLEELYFRLGEIVSFENPDLAIDYYKESIFESNSNSFQKELTYESIGNLYFDKAQFATAGAYYDSVLQISNDENSKRIRRLTRKRNNLDDVIYYGDIALRNDSILEVVYMSNDQRIEYYSSHIEFLKEEERRKEELEKLQQIDAGSSFFKSGNNYEGGSDGKFYFYNTQAVGFGQQEFRNIWGNRPLEDNWRLSEKMSLNLNNSNTTAEVVSVIDNSKKFDLQYYMDQIPKNQQKIDSISQERNLAYYKLGILYKGQFNEIDLAITTLENLLSFNPSDDLKLPAKYHLYKMFSGLNSSQAEVYKEDITSNYPESRYAKIILNPSQVIDDDKANSPEAVYGTVFYEYKDGMYDSVISRATKALITYQEDPIAAKFELLKAYAIGQRDGVIAFKVALGVVVTNFPNTEESKKALEVLQALSTKI